MTPPSIVLVESRQPENKSFGTGFVVAHGESVSYIVTCAHVVRDVGGVDQVKAAAALARVVALGEDNGLDLAVLETPRLHGRSPLLLHEGARREQPVEIEGYYKYIAFRPLEAVRGLLGGSFRLSDTQQQDFVLAWHIAIDDKEKLLGGYSGSPVCDAESGAVFGVVITREGEKQGRAISIAALRVVWPTMPAGLISSVSEPASAPTPVAPMSSSVDVYLAAHPKLRGVADGRDGEVVIDWAYEFIGADPQGPVWQTRFLPELERYLERFNRERRSLIQLRAMARNSAALAFGYVFCQRARFEIHCSDLFGQRWRTGEPEQAPSPLLHRETLLDGASTDLLLEVAVTQVASKVTRPVDVWLNAQATASTANEASDRPTVSLRKRVLLAFEHELKPVSPAAGAAIARQICNIISREGRPGDTVHFFGALPMNVLLLVGWGLKAGHRVQFYDLDAEQRYQPTCLLQG